MFSLFSFKDIQTLIAFITILLQEETLKVACKSSAG
jgi:hypothetical protein